MPGELVTNGGDGVPFCFQLFRGSLATLALPGDTKEGGLSVLASIFFMLVDIPFFPADDLLGETRGFDFVDGARFFSFFRNMAAAPENWLFFLGVRVFIIVTRDARLRRDSFLVVLDSRRFLFLFLS